MEEKVILAAALVVIIAGTVLVIRELYRAAFEKKLLKQKKKYQKEMLAQYAYGETLLDMIAKMADMLSEGGKKKMREKATEQKAITLDCEESASTSGEVMAYDDVERILFEKNSVYEKDS